MGCPVVLRIGQHLTTIIPYLEFALSPKALFDHLPTWQEWLPEYRQLIIEVQDMVEEHTAQGRGRDLVVLMREAARSCANAFD